MAHIELASSNPGKLLQAEKSARNIIELSHRGGTAFETYFDENSIKEVIETRLGIHPDRPVMYALTISQLKMMKHSAELAVREPEKAGEIIPMVTDSIAVTHDEDGGLIGVNRDDLQKDAAFRQRYLELVNQDRQLNYMAFASFTFPGDETIYTVPTYLDADLNRPLTIDEIPPTPVTLPALAKQFSAGYVRLTEVTPDTDFNPEKIQMTSTPHWDNTEANRHEPARQYMGGTTYGVMNLVKAMAVMSPVKRMEFDGHLDDGTSIPFIRVNKKAYEETVSSLPLPSPKSA